MTHEEAVKLKSFDEYCTCGGYAHSMNGRDPADPHMSWCPQREQYNAWYKAINSKTDDDSSATAIRRTETGTSKPGSPS